MKENREIPIIETIFVCDSSENLFKIDGTKVDTVKDTNKINNNNGSTLQAF